MPLYYTQCYYTTPPIWTNEGSKRIIPRIDACVWVVGTTYPHIYGVKPSKD